MILTLRTVLLLLALAFALLAAFNVPTGRVSLLGLALACLAGALLAGWRRGDVLPYRAVGTGAGIVYALRS